jgi:hypothetical protein
MSRFPSADVARAYQLAEGDPLACQMAPEFVEICIFPVKPAAWTFPSAEMATHCQ